MIRRFCVVYWLEETKKTTKKTKNRKSHATSPLVSLAMPQLHCERPCVSVQGLLSLCLALNSRGGTQGRSLLLANHRHVMRRTQCTCCCCCCALALWPCERPRPDNKHGRNGSYFLNLSTDNWIEPNRKRREREGRRRRKTLDGRRVESLKVNTWSGSPLWH